MMFTFGGETEIGSMTINAQGIDVTDLSIKTQGVITVLHKAK
jgi:hypothetical protein